MTQKHPRDMTAAEFETAKEAHLAAIAHRERQSKDAAFMADLRRQNPDLADLQALKEMKVAK